MLAEFINLLKDNGYFYELPIKEIPYSCCNSSDTLALDFDKIKEEFSHRLHTNGQYLKSVDALIINELKNEIFLIEMKYYDQNFSKTPIEYIDSLLELAQAPGKFVDSIFLILGLMGYHGASKQLYEYFFNLDRFKVRPYLLVNLSARDYVLLNTIGKREISISRRLDPDFKIITCEDLPLLTA